MLNRALLIPAVLLALAVGGTIWAQDTDRQSPQADRRDRPAEDRPDARRSPERRPDRQWNRHRDDHPGHEGGRIRRLTEAQEAQLLQALQQRDPNTYQRLRRMRETHPRRYRMFIRRAWSWYQRWKDMPPAVQDAFIRLRAGRVRVWRLAQAVHRAEDEQTRSALKGRLREMLNELYDDRQAVMKHRVEQLEQQLAQLKQRLADQSSRREKVIDDQMERILQARPPRRKAEGGDKAADGAIDSPQP
jgi:hypothetical protein